MPRQRYVRFEDGFFGGPSNPTAAGALGTVAGDQPVLTDSLPPPDRIWIPQLYQLHELTATARISGLSMAKVKQILTDQGIEIRRKGGQTTADKANRSPG